MGKENPLVLIILMIACLAVWAGVANIMGKRLASWTGSSTKRYAVVVIGSFMLIPIGSVALMLIIR